MNFQEKIKMALSTYKKEKLGIHDAGIFKYKGKDLLREHILPEELRDQNIIRHYRDAFFSSSSSVIEFHKYFHHLNSSQALCINLFYPLMVEDKLDLIIDLLGINKTPITETCFEKESDLETGAGRKTNFDYFVQLADKTKIYFEIKFSETKFGNTKKDEEHKNKFTTTYMPLLKNNSFINPEYREMEKFLNLYQIMRNLSHINDNSLVVFVYPKANENIHLQAQTVCEKILTDKGKNKFKILLLETTIDGVLDQIQTPRLRDHYMEFKDKYLSQNAT